MKRQIHAYRGHDEIAVEGHNIKLGRGGIREIEFFVQTQQLIAGGRNPALRGRETLAMLEALAEGGWINAEARRDLEAAYLFLRRSSTACRWSRTSRPTRFPGNSRGARPLCPLSRLCRPRCLRRASWSITCARCRRTTRGCSRTRRPLRRSAMASCSRPRRTTAIRSTSSTRWASAGRSRPRARCGAGWPAETARCAARQRASSSPSLFRCCWISSRGRRTRTPAWWRSTGFSSGLSGGARLISMLRQNPDLVALLATILGTAPRLADTLAHRPQVMDALIDPAFFGALPDEAKLDTQLAASLDGVRVLRGFPRPRAHVRPGAHVPDRRAHPVRHVVGRAGGRGLRAACRRAGPRAPSGDRGQLRAEPRPPARPGERRPGARASSAGAR